MAATERLALRRFGPVVAAALSLPGVMPATVRAETAPDKGSVALKYLYYKDFQETKATYPNEPRAASDRFDRITVKAPSVQVVAPVGSDWTLEGGATVDDVSGATPRYYSSVSGATQAPGGMQDRREAGDVKVTRHFRRGAVAAGFARSHENDYDSNAMALEGRVSSDDNNTTWHAGLGMARDKIGASNDATLAAKRRTHEAMVGVTRVLSANDVVQVNLAYRHGRGHFSDPYKASDRRPDLRRQGTVLAR